MTSNIVQLYVQLMLIHKDSFRNVFEKHFSFMWKLKKRNLKLDSMGLIRAIHRL
jgi:hypothetical protein